MTYSFDSKVMIDIIIFKIKIFPVDYNKLILIRDAYSIIYFNSIVYSSVMVTREMKFICDENVQLFNLIVHFQFS